MINKKEIDDNTLPAERIKHKYNVNPENDY